MTSPSLNVLVLCLLAYVLGSIPVGYIAAAMAGVDITKHGSGNIGTTNVLRVLGPRYAAPVLVLDVGKGALSAYLGMKFLNYGSLGALLVGAFAVIGHNWSPFLGFRGGKGVAASAGVALVAMPYVLMAGLSVFIAVLLITGYVSLASMLGAIAAFGWTLLPGYSFPQRIVVLFLAIMAVWRHRANISRLIQGKEPKLVKKGKDSAR